MQRAIFTRAECAPSIGSNENARLGDKPPHTSPFITLALLLYWHINSHFLHKTDLWPKGLPVGKTCPSTLAAMPAPDSDTKEVRPFTPPTVSWHACSDGNVMCL